MKRAFSILEVAIASTILFVIVGTAMFMFVSTDLTVGESLAITENVQRANRLEDFLSRELRQAGQFQLSGASLNPSGAFTRIQYSPVTGYDFTTQSTGFSASPRQIRFEFSEGPDISAGSGNGLDDDGDGLIDEGNVSLYRDANANGTIEDSEQLTIVVTDVSMQDSADPLPFRLVFVNRSGAESGSVTPETGSDPTVQVRCEFETLKRLPRAQGTGFKVETTRRTLGLAIRN